MSTYQLLYQSSSLVPFGPRELDTLLARARVRNQQRGVNSVLLYTPDGRFLQLIEGPREAVREMYYQHLVADPRQHQCQVLSEGPSETASFDGRPMDFFPAQAPDLRRLLAPVPVPGAALLVPRPHTRPEFVELLLEFMQRQEAVRPPALDGPYLYPNVCICHHCSFRGFGRAFRSCGGHLSGRHRPRAARPLRLGPTR